MIRSEAEAVDRKQRIRDRYKGVDTFTADGLNALLHEAEKIMEGWTDTDE